MTPQKGNLQSRCVSLRTTDGTHEQANVSEQEEMLMSCMWSKRHLGNSGKLKVNSFARIYLKVSYLWAN